MLVTVANSEFAAANSEFARFNILVLITNIRTSLTMTSMILRSVYLLTYLLTLCAEIIVLVQL